MSRQKQNRLAVAKKDTSLASDSLPHYNGSHYFYRWDMYLVKVKIAFRSFCSFFSGALAGSNSLTIYMQKFWLTRVILRPLTPSRVSLIFLEDSERDRYRDFTATDVRSRWLVNFFSYFDILYHYTIYTYIYRLIWIFCRYLYYFWMKIKLHEI